MKSDDIIYLTLLVASIGFGHVFRKLESPGARKWVGTCVGLGITVAVSGWHILHPVILVATNVLIMFHLPRRCVCVCVVKLIKLG